MENQKSKTSTYFAPPERATIEEISRQAEIFRELPEKAQMVNAVPSLLMVLNSQRQLVFANQSLLNYVGEAGKTNLTGMRPGEILNCMHAFELEGGCGTTEFCRTCGAVKAILSSQKGKADIQECRIIRKETGEALDLRVWTTPIEIDGEKMTIIAFSDISDEKRKQVLERIFFHDILNTAGGVKGFADILKRATPDESTRFRDIIALLSDRLIEEILSQRELTAAENNELQINPEKISTIRTLTDLQSLYSSHEAGLGKEIIIDEASPDIRIYTDGVILRRVIGNMMMNALEAAQKGESIRAGCRLKGQNIEYWVHNSDFIPRDTELQIFQRSFSTKGQGRGLGTYSMKLLTERYLKGKIEFSTSVEDGTIFKVIIQSDITA